MAPSMPPRRGRTAISSVTFARDAYYPDPPLTCIDSITGETVWRSKARTPTEHFGNCRVTPMIVDSYVIAAFAYSDSLHIFDKMTGDNVATVKIGPQVFQQWSAPTLFGAHHVLLGRVDGVVSIVDVKSAKLVTSVSLTNRQVKSLEIDNVAREDQTFPLYPRSRPRGVCGTPAVLGNVIYVGTTSSDLFAIELSLCSL